MKQAFSKKNRALLAELVRTDFKLRYQGSALGYTWSLLRPLLLFLILYIVFIKFLRIGKGFPHFPIYLLLGIVIWNFFLEMTVRCTTAIVDRSELISKIRIPRWIIIVSSSVSALINFFLNLLVVIGFLLINHVDLLRTSLWLPLILLEVYLFALGLSLLLSAAYVKFRDVIYIWEVVTQAGFYITPILYPVAVIANLHFAGLQLEKLIFMNPMAQAIQDARYASVTHQSETVNTIFNGGPLFLVPYCLAAAILVIGILYFKSQSKYFAENI